MFLNKLRISVSKLLIPFFYKIFKLLKSNTRVINYFYDKNSAANNVYNFQNEINNLLKSKKLVALDVGSQGGFNSDEFFPSKYNNNFFQILVDPFNSSSKDKNIIRKGLWSSKCIKKFYILKNRPQSSSMYEPDEESLAFYDLKDKNFDLFKVSETKMIECDTLASSLKELEINYLDYLKIDTQGAEFEILKGLENYRPLMIKCETQVFPMYKEQPKWIEIVKLLYELDYILIDWKKIGPHATRTPVEMDMIFIPSFKSSAGKKLILKKEKQFISLMLMTGQLKLLQKISKFLSLNESNNFMHIEDKFFN